MTRLTEIYSSIHHHKTGREYNLREIYVNPTTICMIIPEPTMQQKLDEGILPDGLDQRVEFSRLSVNDGGHGRSLIVIGSPSMIEEKIKSGKQLLKG